MQFTGEQNRRRIWLELKDLLTGTAFPIILQLIFSASIILFADYTEEIALSVAALLFGELLLLGAYVVFGRQNGITAYRRTVQGEKKRAIQPDDITAQFRTGEYAIWKGFVIGLISVVPFMIFQFINCVAPNSVCEFILQYAFGWAAFPFKVIGQATGELSQWLNFIWIVIPVGVHAGAYVWGAHKEVQRQKKLDEAQQLKGKRKK